MRVLAIAMGLVLAVAVHAKAATPALIGAVGVENEYADVISQIGGQYVHTTAIESDPNTDPHTLEVSPSVASAIADAALVVKNGVGYDSWADKILAAAPRADRQVIDVQHLLGLPDDTANPHLWYDSKDHAGGGKGGCRGAGGLMPAQVAYFQANAARFDDSVKPWLDAIAAFKAAYGGTAVAVTEPAADYMLQAAGCDIATPYSLQSAIMNGTDPSPQDIAAQNALFDGHKVKVFIYNQQVTDSLTQSFLERARKNGIPVVGVYETMPEPGFTYQSWMVAEVRALHSAVADKVSTEELSAGQ